MGWDMYDSSRPKMYDYIIATGQYQYSPSIPSWNWAIWNIWKKWGVAIRYINDTKQSLKFNKVSMRILSCNSGGQSFWGYNGRVDGGCYGHGATYTLTVRVCNTPGAKDLPYTSWANLSYEKSSPIVNALATDSFNMNYAGTSTTDSARFGDPPYTFPLRDFNISDSPILKPGGFALFNLVATNPVGGNGYSDPTIRFSMNPHEMIVDIEPEINPYIWRASKENGKIGWHLVRPVQLNTADGWQNIEGDER